MEYVLVAAEEGGEVCEVDLEPNSTLGLGTVQALACDTAAIPEPSHWDATNHPCLGWCNPSTEGWLRKDGVLVGAVQGESAIATLCIKSGNYSCALSHDTCPAVLSYSV